METAPDWECMLQVFAMEELGLMPAMLSLAAIKAPKLRHLAVSTHGEAVPSILLSISLLSNLEELKVCGWDFPDNHNTLAIINLSGLRALKVKRLCVSQPLNKTRDLKEDIQSTFL